MEQQDKEQMKFGSAYGVSRKVVDNKVWWLAKLPANQSKTGKSVKLGMYPTATEAGKVVQHALLNPGEYHDESTRINQVTPVSEVLEPSYCERIEATNRSSREKNARKTKALAKKEVQRNSQINIGENFMRSIDEAFEELRRLNSYSRFSRGLEASISQILEIYFPKNGDIETANHKQGAREFCHDALRAMWHTDQDGLDQTPWSGAVCSVSDFVESTELDSTQQYGNW
eukprot:CAMPEP_0114328706 /NCGR_PEP_ID=MMETSP0101-20121206/590_1 /TAXON_ID=38822 ORGANISM="Pteridomonas danica, Strain PT" /NCGR_SAMPLE_ID=MMETSP0101 /ASSEMBLY_ACC=CAM_ASM_000211 /LENGTH=228 /DNA_ID=CAMNT_0001458127 /DNA_START=129 /DNA_END=812 /DNA_ORIENTATION=+